jgi:hypothetical protein
MVLNDNIGQTGSDKRVTLKPPIYPTWTMHAVGIREAELGCAQSNGVGCRPDWDGGVARRPLVGKRKFCEQYESRRRQQ